MEHFGLMWAVIVNEQGKQTGFVVSVNTKLYYVIKSVGDNYLIADAQGNVVCFVQGIIQVWTCLYGKAFNTRNIYFNMNKTEVTEIVPDITGATNTILERFIMPESVTKGTVSKLFKLNLANCKAYVTTRVSETEYAVLSIIEDKAEGFKVKAAVMPITEIYKNRRGKYYNIVFRENDLEYRNITYNKKVGNGFLPIKLLSMQGLINMGMKSEAGQGGNNAEQRSRQVYDKVLAEMKPYTSPFVKQSLQDVYAINSKQMARLRQVVYYGQFGRDKSAVAMMDILLGNSSELKNNDEVFNWSNVIRRSLQGEVKSTRYRHYSKRKNRINFYKSCYYYLQALCQPFTGDEKARHGTMRHQVLGWLCDTGAMQLLLYSANKSVNLRNIVVRFIDDILRQCVFENVHSQFVSIRFDDFFTYNNKDLVNEALKKLIAKDVFPKEIMRDKAKLIDYVTEHLASNLEIMRKTYCIEILESFANKSGLYKFESAEYIVNKVANDSKAMSILFEVCLYLRYHFMNPAIPVVKPLPFKKVFRLDEYRGKMILPPYSVTRVYLKGMGDISEKDYWSPLLPACVFVEQTKGMVEAIPVLKHTSTCHNYWGTSSVFNPEQLQAMSKQYNIDALSALLYFVALAYNKFDKQKCGKE